MFRLLFFHFPLFFSLLNVISVSAVTTECSTIELDGAVKSTEYRSLSIDKRIEFIENYRYYCINACLGWETIINSPELYKDSTYEEKLEIRKIWFEKCVLNSNKYKSSSLNNKSKLRSEWFWLGLSTDDFYKYNKTVVSIKKKYTTLINDSINQYHSCVEKAAKGAITDTGFKVLNRICATKRNQRKDKLKEEGFYELRKIKNMYFPNGIPH